MGYYYNEDEKHSTGCSLQLVNLLAFTISYMTWHSLPWAVFHMFLGWYYIIYWIIMYLLK